MPVLKQARRYSAEEYARIERIARQRGIGVEEAEEQMLKEMLAQLEAIEAEGNVIGFPGDAP